MSRYTSFVLGMLVMFVLAVWGPLLLKNRGPLDDTDNKVTGARSDMRILIDYGTSCQYLVNAQGGMTARLDGAGQQKCPVSAPQPNEK